MTTTDLQLPSLPPALLHTDRPWHVSRVWPATRHGVPVELRPADSQPADAVRAGWWRPFGLTLLPPGSDPKLPALAQLTGTVVSHRPGKRAVVRTPGHHIKVVRPGRAPAVLDGIARAGAFAAAFRMPAVVDSDSDTVVFETLGGRSLHRPEAFGDDEWRRAWQDVLTAHAATALADRDEGAIPVHDAAAEVAVLRRWAAHWADSTLDWAGDLRRAVDRVCAELLHGEPRPLRPIHRDLHDKQLLWDPRTGPGVLDVDTACRGEAELDLGNLRAHARWRRLQGVWSAADSAAVLQEIDRAVPEPAAAERMGVYERAALLRIACVHAFRPADRPVTGDLVAAVTRVTATAATAG